MTRQRDETLDAIRTARRCAGRMASRARIDARPVAAMQAKTARWHLDQALAAVEVERPDLRVAA
jgi:hypothetical protein